MMSKSEQIQELVKLLAPKDKVEQARLTKHHSKRSLRDVRESLQRQRAIAATTQAEINQHCQTPPPPSTLGKTRGGNINFYELGIAILADGMTGIDGK